ATAGCGEKALVPLAGQRHQPRFFTCCHRTPFPTKEGPYSIVTRQAIRRDLSHPREPAARGAAAGGYVMAFEWQVYIDLRKTWVNKTQADNWETAVRNDLKKIAGVQTGRILLNGLRFWGKWIVVTHYDFSQGAVNAFVEERTGTARDGHAYGATVKYSP